MTTFDAKTYQNEFLAAGATRVDALVSVAATGTGNAAGVEHDAVAIEHDADERREGDLVGIVGQAHAGERDAKNAHREINDPIHLRHQYPDGADRQCTSLTGRLTFLCGFSPSQDSEMVS